MSQLTNMFSSGLKPVYKIIPDHEKWRNIPAEVLFEKSEETFTLQFSHTFD